VLFPAQWTTHRNTALVNLLWLHCDELNEKMKAEIGRHTGTTERCYAHAISKLPHISVKFATKAMTDFGALDRVLMYDGVVAECPSPRVTECADLIREAAAAAADGIGAGAGAGGGGGAGGSLLSPAAALKRKREQLMGVQFSVGPPIALADWWTKYKVCATFPSGEDPSHFNMFFHNGTFFAQKYRNGDALADVKQSFFWHFQTWKSLKYWHRDNWQHALPYSGSDTPSSSPSPFYMTIKGMFPWKRV